MYEKVRRLIYTLYNIHGYFFSLKVNWKNVSTVISGRVKLSHLFTSVLSGVLLYRYYTVYHSLVRNITNTFFNFIF